MARRMALTRPWSRTSNPAGLQDHPALGGPPGQQQRTWQRDGLWHVRRRSHQRLQLQGHRAANWIAYSLATGNGSCPDGETHKVTVTGTTTTDGTIDGCLWLDLYPRAPGAPAPAGPRLRLQLGNVYKVWMDAHQSEVLAAVRRTTSTTTGLGRPLRLPPAPRHRHRRDHRLHGRQRGNHRHQAPHRVVRAPELPRRHHRRGDPHPAVTRRGRGRLRGRGVVDVPMATRRRRCRDRTSSAWLCSLTPGGSTGGRQVAVPPGMFLIFG